VIGSSQAALDISDQPDVLGEVCSRNTESLTDARRAIDNARVVRLAGFGSSKHAAGYGALALEVFAGLPAVVLPAPGEAVALPEPRTDEPLIVLSQSGRTPALLAVAQRASDVGVTVIAVTNEIASPLEQVASVTLHCGAGAERVVAATKSVTAQCLLLRALAQPPDGTEIEALVRAVRSAIDLDVCAALATEPPSSVVAGGFAAEWIADEIALKLTEVCGLAVTSESVVEYFHGPRASGTPVLAFLEADDPNAADLKGNMKKVGPGASFDVSMPVSGEASLDAIVRLVVGQHIAVAWADVLGVDPDAARGLRKVTGTR
jgi:glucosamine--fructose-6-phosphate aminotransferase (isomerizing)